MKEKLYEIYLNKKSYLLQFKKYEDLKNALIELTPDILNIGYAERLYILFNPDSKIKCPGCGKETKFQDITHGYRKYCSNECKRLFIYTEERQYKIKQTCFANYGVDNPGKSSVIREHAKETCMKRYNVSSYSKTDECKEKTRNTCMNLYNVSSYSKTNECKEKLKKTFIERYNVDHNFKIPEARESINKKLAQRFFTHEFGKYYDFEYPSGKKIRTQGYENKALFELLCLYDESDIIAGKHYIRDFLGKIEYHYKDQTHEYFPDIYIKSENKIIEVKSYYTYELHKEQNHAKQNRCLDIGYAYEFWIYDKLGNKIIIK